MSAAEFDAQINAQAARISSCQQEIQRLEDKLAALLELHAKTDTLAELVQSAAGSMSRKLGGALQAGIAGVQINPNAFADVDEAIRGEGFQGALSGIASSQTIITDKGQELKSRVEEFQEAIRQAQNQIYSLERQKEEFMAEQARAAAAGKI